MLTKNLDGLVCCALTLLPSSICGCLQVQRLQRFATYGYLKQIVLKMIASDLADPHGSLSDEQSEALDMVTALR